MALTLAPMRPRDGRKAMEFAFVGMHFQWYTDKKLFLSLYTHYFWYLELTRATQIIAAYEDGRLAGVLLAAVRGEKPACPSVWKRLYVKLFERMQELLEPGGSHVYEETNQELFRSYARRTDPDGEILFLAADPTCPPHGVGSALLAELERRERGKTFYLYTDDACTYQFYERRGFVRAGEKQVVIEVSGRKTDLLCLLYSKVLGS